MISLHYINSGKQQTTNYSAYAIQREKSLFRHFSSKYNHV